MRPSSAPAPRSRTRRDPRAPGGCPCRAHREFLAAPSRPPATGWLLSSTGPRPGRARSPAQSRTPSSFYASIPSMLSLTSAALVLQLPVPVIRGADILVADDDETSVRFLK